MNEIKYEKDGLWWCITNCPYGMEVDTYIPEIIKVGSHSCFMCKYNKGINYIEKKVTCYKGD